MIKPASIRRLCDQAAQHWPLLLAGLGLVCALLPWAFDAAPAIPPTGPSRTDDWPRVWRGQALQPMALSAVEDRFARQFPGRIARFSLADESELVWREVQRPTRMLHPAADCWRGIGWQVQPAQLRRDEQADLWRCFEAWRATDGGTERVRVCERIVDAHGRAFTDTSAWFWAATLGKSQGPWQAITHVEGL
jgi:hypothetical protein